MNTQRRRAAVLAIPMFIALVAAQRATPHMRTVDFLLVFAAGTIFGVTLSGVIRLLGRSAQGG